MKLKTLKTFRDDSGVSFDILATEDLQSFYTYANQFSASCSRHPNVTVLESDVGKITEQAEVDGAVGFPESVINLDNLLVLMTEREQKLQRTLEWLIDLLEDAVNKTDDYCRERCPVRDHDRNCPAELFLPHWDGEDEYYNFERDYQKCMKLQVEWYVEKANHRR